MPNTNPNQAAKLATPKLPPIDAKGARIAKINAKKLEVANLDHLYFVSSTDGWSKLTFNSAIFFETDVRPRLKSPHRFHLKADLDNYAISPCGIISLRLDGALSEELASLKITKDSDLSEPGITAFKLPWQYRPDDVKRLVAELNQEQNQANELVKPKNLIPELYIALTDLNTMLYQNCRRLPDQFTRDTLGRDLYDKSFAAAIHYLNAANGAAPCEDELYRILKNLTYLRHAMSVSNYLKVIPAHHAVRIETQIILAERITKKYLNGIKKND